jgi:hypothetical protein
MPFPVAQCAAGAAGSDGLNVPEGCGADRDAVVLQTCQNGDEKDAVKARLWGGFASQ